LSVLVLVVVQEAIDIALHIASDEGWEHASSYRDSFACGDVGEGVLDGGAFTQQGTSRLGLLQLPELPLAQLVRSHGDGSSTSGGGLRALRAKGASSASLGVELHGVTGLERFDFSRWAGDRFRAQVYLEVPLAE
jgi:hypothetical protein